MCFEVLLGEDKFLQLFNGSEGGFEGLIDGQELLITSIIGLFVCNLFEGLSGCSKQSLSLL